MRNESNKLEQINPSRQLTTAVKRAFEDKGDSITAYCRRENLDRRDVRKALMGLWNGKKGKAVRQKVVAAALANHA